MNRRKKKKEEAELDITPMIDVTFLLLIFFMVTSTMQATPDRDIPPSKSGDNVVKSEWTDVTVGASRTGGEDGEFLWDGTPVTLDQLKEQMIQAATGELKILIYAERDVPNGVVGEVERIIGEVAKETETTIEMSFAVQGIK